MYNLIGQKFSKLLVICKSTEEKKTRQLVWKCLCDCGNTTYVDSYSLRHNKTKSCGCSQYVKENYTYPIKHGMYNTRTYHTWEQMKQRCLNPKATRFPTYGAVGILLCDRWLDFENFFLDMGLRPEGKTLDRINPFGNYEPSNCRWATPKEQQNNQRRHYKTGEVCAPC